MQTEHRSEHLGNVEKVVTGGIVDTGPDHLTVHDEAAGGDTTVRIDDRTRIHWLNPQHQGRLTDNGRVRVGFYIAGGVHVATEVLVLEPGDGALITDRFTQH